MNKPVIFGFILLTLFFLSCATAKKMRGMQIGMSRDLVIDKLGLPYTMRGIYVQETFIYRFSDTDDDELHGIFTEYQVVFERGKVARFGKSVDVERQKDIESAKYKAAEDEVQMKKRRPAGSDITDPVPETTSGEKTL